MKPITFFVFILLIPLAKSGMTETATHQSQCATDTNAFFPLLQGSYWIWQDTILRKQDLVENAESMNPSKCFMKDSISSLLNNGRFCIVTVKRTITAASVDTYSFDYQIDSNGNIWYSNSKKHKIASAIPKQGDTVFDEIGTKYIFKNQITDCAVATSSFEKVFYQKGVGCTNRMDINKRGKNLIEYRIGNGPIIKKHWLMEAPVNK